MKRLYNDRKQVTHPAISVHGSFDVQTVLTPLQTSSKAVMAAFVLLPQRLLICDLTFEASDPHTTGRSAGASSVLKAC